MNKCPYCAEEIQDDAVICRFCGRTLHDLAHPIHWFWYLIIGLASLFGLSIMPVLLILSDILAGKQPSNPALIFGSLLSLCVFLAFFWVPAKAKYGKVNFWGICNVFVVSSIPFIGLWSIYYFGKGIYMLFTKQNLPIPNKPSKLGGIIFLSFVALDLIIWIYDKI